MAVRPRPLPRWMGYMKNVDIVRIDLSGKAREGSGGSEVESREMWPAF